MRTLVIDCATPALSLALFEGQSLVRGHHEEIGRGHAEAVVPAIDAIMGRERADRVCVDIGPGSFTGIRVGLSVARALGLAWGSPVEGFGCLPLCAAIAREASAAGDEDEPIAVVMTGGHGEFFWQRFDRATLNPLGPQGSASLQALTRQVPEYRLWGSGAAALIAERGWGLASPLLPDARLHGLLPKDSKPVPAAAFYGREADAAPMSQVGPSIALPVLCVYDGSVDGVIPGVMSVMESAFDPAFGEAWSSAQLRSMLDLPGTRLITASIGDVVAGFALLRTVVDECELLLLGVAPGARRRRLGTHILQHCIDVAKGSGARTMFLEVREDNDAIAFYLDASFERYGSRPDYYVGRDGKRRNAYSLRRAL